MLYTVFWILGIDRNVVEHDTRSKKSTPEEDNFTLKIINPIN